MHSVKRTLIKQVRNFFFSEYKIKKMTSNSRILAEDSLLIRCKKLAPPLTLNKHKGQAGRIGVFGGSLEYTGAPYYAAITSLKVGADLVYVFCMKDAATVIKSYSPELIVLPYLDHEQAQTKIEPWLERLHVILIGPGLGRDKATIEVVEQVIRSCRKLMKPLVIDADGLFLLANNIEIIRNYPAKLIVTPNVMEFSRLVGNTDDSKYRDNSANLFKICPNLTILRKGPEDIIFDEKVEVKVVSVGSGRRSGGQGDLLAGSVATFLTWSLQNKACDEGHKTHDDRAVLAAFAGSKLIRECNRLAFSKFGRSMTALDMTHEVHTVFDLMFENKGNAESTLD